MTIPALKLEVKKDGFQQLQSGAYKLTVTLQPADMHDNDETLLLDFIKAPMGTRYYIGMAEIGPDEKPKPTRKPAATRAEKARRMCGVEQFQTWLGTSHRWNTNLLAGMTPYEQASFQVKHRCNVKSKSEFDANPEAAKRWDFLFEDYEQSVGRMAQRTG